MSNFSGVAHIQTASGGGKHIYQPPQREPFTRAPYPEKQPNALELGLAGLGQGLGKGFEQGMRKQIEKQSVHKTLEMLRSNPHSSALDQLEAIHDLPPEIQKYAADIFEQQEKRKSAQEEAQNFSNAIGSIMGNHRANQNQTSSASPNPSTSQSNNQQADLRQPMAKVTDPNNRKIVWDVVKHKQDQEFKTNERRIERAQKRLAPQLEAYDEYAKTQSYRRTSLQQQKEAVQKGLNIGDVLAEMTSAHGGELLRSPQGAKFKVAGKDYFLNSLSRIRGRPNQWIEQQLSDAQAKIGRSKEANLQTIAAQEFDLDVGDKELEIANELAKYYDTPEGEMKGDLVQEVHKILKPYVIDREKQLGYEMQRIHEQENPKEWKHFMRVTPGTPLTIERARWILDRVGGDVKKAEQAAKDAGYDTTFVPKS